MALVLGGMAPGEALVLQGYIPGESPVLLFRVLQNRFVRKQLAQVIVRQCRTLFLETFPDRLPAFIVQVKAARQDADRLAPVVGDDAWFCQLAGHVCVFVLLIWISWNENRGGARICSLRWAASGYQLLY